jgi:branched-chain amino acid transport system substrate-binding protein
MGKHLDITRRSLLRATGSVAGGAAAAFAIPAGNPKDKAAVAKAISTLNVETAAGIIDFTNGPAPSMAATGLVGTQWLKDESGKFPFKLEVTSNFLINRVPTTASLKPYTLG